MFCAISSQTNVLATVRELCGPTNVKANKRILILLLLIVLHPWQVSGRENGNSCSGGSLDEGFEGGEIPYNWMVHDGDGSGETWQAGGWLYTRNGDYSVRILNAGGDDWLITPKLIVGEGDSVIFWAKSHYYTILADFEVLVSTTDTAVESFTAILDTVSEALPIG